jgi:hypothetical protein
MDANRPRTIRYAFVLGISCLSLALLTACSSDPGEQAATPSETPVKAENNLPAGITEAQFQAYLTSANDFVRPLIADRAVSADEYERAVLRVMQCLDDEGVRHSQPELTQTLDGPRWTYTVGPAAELDAQRQTAVHDRCDAEYLRVPLTFWEAQSQPSEADLRQRDSDYLACLQDAGLEVASIDEAETLFREKQLSPTEIQERVRCRLLAYEGVEGPP